MIMWLTRITFSVKFHLKNLFWSVGFLLFQKIWKWFVFTKCLSIVYHSSKILCRIIWQNRAVWLFKNWPLEGNVSYFLNRNSVLLKNQFLKKGLMSRCKILGSFILINTSVRKVHHYKNSKKKSSSQHGTFFIFKISSLTMYSFFNFFFSFLALRIVFFRLLDIFMFKFELCTLPIAS